MKALGNGLELNQFVIVSIDLCMKYYAWQAIKLALLPWQSYVLFCFVICHFISSQLVAYILLTVHGREHVSAYVHSNKIQAWLISNLPNMVNFRNGNQFSIESAGVVSLD